MVELDEAYYEAMMQAGTGYGVITTALLEIFPELIGTGMTEEIVPALLRELKGYREQKAAVA